jgi:HEPN domain-containing protein
VLLSSEQVKRWLRKAEENLRVAEVTLKEDLYAYSCFHAQQAAELALKALIILRKGYQPFTHLLTELAAEVSDDASLRLPSAEELRWLQEQYVQSRYPNARLSEYTREEAVKAVEVARRVINEVKREIYGGGV